MEKVKALFFDVFGTLVDWRSSIAREVEAALAHRGHALDWSSFADAWRGEYQPAMEEVRSFGADLHAVLLSAPKTANPARG